MNRRILLPASMALILAGLTWIIGSFTLNALYELVGIGEAVPWIPLIKYNVGQLLLLAVATFTISFMSYRG